MIVNHNFWYFCCNKHYYITIKIMYIFLNRSTVEPHGRQTMSPYRSMHRSWVVLCFQTNQMKETLRGLSSRFYNNHYTMIMLYMQNLDPLDVSKVFTRQRSSRKNARILICSTKCIDGQIERRANIGNLFTDCAVFCFFLVNGLILRRFFFGLTQFVYGSNRTVFLTNQQIN